MIGVREHLDRLRAAADVAEAAALASETDVPDWVVEVIGATQALLRELEVKTQVSTTPGQRVEQRSQSVACGYTGDACSNCGSFTLRRKGTCLSCDSCSHSSGCS